MTSEEFITTWPLYTPAVLERFRTPSSVSYYCPTASTCVKETTWLRVGDTKYTRAEEISGAEFHWVWYQCGLCSKSFFVVIYRESDYKSRQVASSSGLSLRGTPPNATVSVSTKVQKFGQFPAHSIVIPNGLEKNLGVEAANLYKKGLVNRNSGYGLDAVTYIRRVVEDKTNELIEVAAQQAESLNVDTAAVKKIRAAATEKKYLRPETENCCNSYSRFFAD